MLFSLTATLLCMCWEGWNGGFYCFILSKLLITEDIKLLFWFMKNRNFHLNHINFNGYQTISFVMFALSPQFPNLFISFIPFSSLEWLTWKWGAGNLISLHMLTVNMWNVCIMWLPVQYIVCGYMVNRDL